MHDVAIFASKALLGVVLLVAGAAKLSDIRSFATTTSQLFPMLVLKPLARVVAPAIAVTEVLAGAASLSFPGETWLNTVVLVLAGSFVAVSAYGYTFHRGQPCTCFGALSTKQFDATSILRSALLAGLAVVALGTVRRAALDLTAAERLLLLCAAALLYLASLTAARALATVSAARPWTEPK